MKLTFGLLLLCAGGGAFLLPPQEVEQEGQPISISHPDPKFRMTLPRGYKPATSPPASAAYAFERSGLLPVMIVVEPLNGRLAPNVDEAELQAQFLKGLPEGAQVRVMHEPWSKYEILVLESIYTVKGIEAFDLVAYIPIIPRAVKVTVAGRKTELAQGRDDLKSVLARFYGKTDWLTSAQRWTGITAGGISVLGWLLLAVYGILYRTMYKGNVLRHWRFRVSYLTAVVISLSTSVAFYCIYMASKDQKPMDVTFYFLAGVAGATAVKTGDLYQKGVAQRKAAAAPQPPPA